MSVYACVFVCLRELTARGTTTDSTEVACFSHGMFRECGAGLWWFTSADAFAFPRGVLAIVRGVAIESPPDSPLPLYCRDDGHNTKTLARAIRYTQHTRVHTRDKGQSKQVSERRHSTGHKAGVSVLSHPSKSRSRAWPGSHGATRRSRAQGSSTQQAMAWVTVRRCTNKWARD